MSATSSGGKYTRELKLRVLEHYFRNGGDVFGNKQATSKKFGVDSKTINRFLKLADLVRLARKNAKSSGKSSSSFDNFKEPAAPGGSGRPQRQAAKPALRINLPEDADEAVINQPADQNTSSVGKLIKVFELGTQELRDLLLAECDLVYECRVCRGLFRCLANLLAHKRRFCTRAYRDTRQVFGDGPGQSLSTTSDGVVILPLPAAIDRLPEVRQAAAVAVRAAVAEPLPTVRLETLPNTRAAVAQTVGEQERTTVDRLDELARMEAARGNTVRLGRDGKVVESGDEEEGMEAGGATVPGEEERHVCKLCNTTFSTRKTLSHHVRSLHAATRVYFPCACCSAAFINMFSVERHLQKAHKKRPEEIETLKEAIRKKAFQRNVSQADVVPPGSPLKVANTTACLRCGECGLQFPSMPTLAGHVATAHVRTADALASDIQERRCYLPTEQRGRQEEVRLDKPSRSAGQLVGRTGRTPVSDQVVGRADANDIWEASATSGMTGVSDSQQGKIIDVSDDELDPQNRESSSSEAASGAPPMATAEDSRMERRMRLLCDVKRLRCRDCGLVSPALWNLRRHVATHVGWTRYGCVCCAYRAFTRSSVVKHMRRQHGVPQSRALAMLAVEQRRLARADGAQADDTAKPRGSVGTAEDEMSAETPRSSSDSMDAPTSDCSLVPAKSLQVVTNANKVPVVKTYEMRDLSKRHNVPTRYQEPTMRGAGILPVLVPPRGVKAPLWTAFLPGRGPARSPLKRGRKSLASIIHYLRSGETLQKESSVFAEQSSHHFDVPIGEMHPGDHADRDGPNTNGQGDVFGVETVDAGDSAKAAEPINGSESSASKDDDDDDWDAFLALDSGGELEPGAEWSTLPSLLSPMRFDDVSPHGERVISGFKEFVGLNRRGNNEYGADESSEIRNPRPATDPDVAYTRAPQRRVFDHPTAEHDFNENIGPNESSLKDTIGVLLNASEIERRRDAMTERASCAGGFFPRVMLHDCSPRKLSVDDSDETAVSLSPRKQTQALPLADSPESAAEYAERFSVRQCSPESAKQDTNATADRPGMVKEVGAEQEARKSPVTTRDGPSRVRSNSLGRLANGRPSVPDSSPADSGARKLRRTNSKPTTQPRVAKRAYIPAHGSSPGNVKTAACQEGTLATVSAPAGSAASSVESQRTGDGVGAGLSRAAVRKRSWLSPTKNRPGPPSGTAGRAGSKRRKELAATSEATLDKFDLVKARRRTLGVKSYKVTIRPRKKKETAPNTEQ